MFCKKCFGDRAEGEAVDRADESVAFVTKGDVGHGRTAALQGIDHLLRFRRHDANVIQALRDQDRLGGALEMIEW